MVALFAALIAPWFINWDNYRVNFEREASRILGHPVHVSGSAHASILPAPSLTFSDVQVGEVGGEPMMTVERFEVTIELMPLIQGEIRVVAMKLDKPKVRVAADEAGVVDWLKRAPSAQSLDPDKVVLGNVEISDGALEYSDARTGVALSFAGINASVEARSLAGPWKAEGSYREGARAVPFHFGTGRQLEDGTIRLQAEFSPPQWPVAVTADGVLANKPDTGVSYAGTYSVTEVVDAGQQPQTKAGQGAAALGWRSEGTFALTRDRVVVDKAILSNGPVESPSSIAGSLTVDFGKQPSFNAVAEARQLDIDSSLGGGPAQPVNVAAAATGFVGWLKALPVPPMPGRIAFNVPAIVVGGSVIQDVAFAAEPAAAGWKIEGFRAHLPGQASISADGVLTTDRAVGFVGSARLAVAQPATFAAWWRGGGQAGSGRLLSAFDISGDTEIAEGRVSVDKINARIGDATITGRFAWSEAARDHHRHLGTDLKADRIDFVQVKALADLLIGRDLTDTGALADSFSIRLAADAFQYEDVSVKGVAVDAAYADDVLTVVQLAIADLDGASFRVTSGRIDDLTTNARGHLDARLEATTLDGLTQIAGKLAPDSGLYSWLVRTAPVVTPAFVNARVTAQPSGGKGFQVALDGVAGQTTFNTTIESAATNWPDWREAAATVALALDSPDSAGLAKQLGFAAKEIDADPGAHLAISGKGVPKDGLDATIEADFAGLSASAKGKLAFAESMAPQFTGAFGLAADDLAPFIASAGLAIPGAAAGTPVKLDGTLTTSGGEAGLDWKNGTVAERVVSGAVKVAQNADRGWRVDGDLTVDAVDLGWLASLSLGFAPEPTDNPKTPWSKTPFSPPTYGPVSGKLTVATEHLSVGEGLDVTGGKLALALQPHRIDVDLKDGHLAGGIASGGVSIQNVEGSANLTGQFNLTGAALESFVWQRQGRVVGTGALDLSANFEATGRSPAGLVSSMTGGGVIAVHNGVARYVNPQTARVIVRISDLGEPFSDEALRAAVEEQIDADQFAFAETGGAFSIAAGTVRMSGLSARGDGVEADGNAVIDLNAMTLDSDWTLTFAGGDTPADAGDAKIGVVFRGPLAEPSRIIDALPFNSYLSSRQAARMLDVIATEEADRAEHQRLLVQLAKIRDDTARAERVRQQQIDAARRRSELSARATAAIAALHLDREIQGDERAGGALVRAAERSAAVAAAAQNAAIAAADNATAARAKADEAAAALATAIAADMDSAATAAKAMEQFTEAQGNAATTGETAAKTAAAAEAAERAAVAAIDAETTAKRGADKAAADFAEAKLALDAATARAASTAGAAVAAAAEAKSAKDALDAAGRALTDTSNARDASATALASASAALAKVQAAADESNKAAADALNAATQADADRARLEMTAKAAADTALAAQVERDKARQVLDEATATYKAKVADLDEAVRADPGGGGVAVLARRAAADHAKETLEIATGAYNAAETAASDAAATSSGAQAAAEAAATRAAAAAAQSDQASASNKATLAILAEKIAARDEAQHQADASEMAAKDAGAAFNAAQTAANATTDRAAAAQAAAEAAAGEQVAATRASTAASAGVEAFALEQAVAARANAVADATATRGVAESAKAAALAAAQALADVTTVHDAVTAAAEVAHAGRIANEQAAGIAKSAAERAEAEAAAAADAAKARAADAEAAARRLQPEAADGARTVAVPLPRQRQKPLGIVPDALAGDAPMALTPPAQ